MNIASRTFLLLALACIVSGCLSAGARVPVQPIAFSQSEALSEVNAFRRANGLGEVRLEPRLTQAAEAQAASMAERGRLAHNVDGRLPARLSRFGYDWEATAENIGRGYLSISAANEGWIGSPEHRRNLLNPRVTEIGMAGSRSSGDGRNYWAQILGKERSLKAAGGSLPVR